MGEEMVNGGIEMRHLLLAVPYFLRWDPLMPRLVSGYELAHTDVNLEVTASAAASQISSLEASA